MASRRKSALDQINELLTPAPEIGSDDDLDYDTKAKVVEDFDNDFSEEEKPRGGLLKQSATLDDDPRYTGKRVSRRNFGVADDTENEFSNESGEEHYSDDTSNTVKHVKSNKVAMHSDNEAQDDFQSDDEEELDSEDRESSDEYSVLKRDGTDEEECPQNLDSSAEANDTFQHISSTRNVESEIEKGRAVKNQLHIWDNLLECRIHLQKCAIPANRLPKYQKIDAFVQHGGKDFASEMKRTHQSIKKLLNKFLDLQKTLLDNYSETKNIENKAIKRKCESDEEITSDSDNEVDCNNSEVQETKKTNKKTRLQDYEDILSTEHKQFIEFRDATIQKWNDRTKMITGKASSRDFSAFEQSTLQQIRHVLNNRTRLIQRTRIPRTVGRVLGEEEPTDESSQPDHDPEIFDDSDFYHQLLRELIEKRTDNTQDSIALGRRWAALQKMRTKMKRRLDTKATKGRRLRYDPHQKLVGYMAPIVSSSEWSDKAISELFNSLFGKRT